MKSVIASAAKQSRTGQKRFRNGGSMPDSKLILTVLLLTAMPITAAAQAPGATIVKFSALTKNDPNADANDQADGSGPLRITYSDGTVITIPNEHGDMNDGTAVVPQADFSDIKLSPDHRTLGWLAEYSMCAQSYPCPLELVLYTSGKPPRKIKPIYGIFWNWMFTDNGSQIIAQSGYPHGDANGAFGMYETATGHELASYSLQTNAPDWVRAYLAQNPF